MNGPAFADDLHSTLERLRQAQLRHESTLAERRELLARLAAAIRKHQDEIATAASLDFGRRARFDSLVADVWIPLEEIAHARRHLRRWMRPQRRRVNLAFLPARAELRYRPLGVVGIMAPWNYPLQLALLPLVGAIAAGNRVMIKPSEFTPRVGECLAAIVQQVFTPEQVVVVRGDASVGAAFAALPFDHLLFTGSTAVGRKVMAAAASNLTPVTLELGGKSPALVAPGYDVERAADRIASGKCFNGGQTCIATDYVLVPREQRDAFVRAYLAAVKKRFPHLADNPDATAVVNPRQAQRLRDMIEDARRRNVAVMQHRPDSHEPPPGVEVITPTVLLDPPDEAQAMREEIFGPVLPVKSYASLDEAIAYVQGRDRPLAFYLFDDDRARIERVLGRIVAGGVCVNDTVIQYPQHDLPFGGVGPSGMGQCHGHAGFLTFSKAMPVLRQSRWHALGLFDPPYSPLAHKLLRFLIGDAPR
jgi:coniferyl-aldehyde dehydrogenase